MLSLRLLSTIDWNAFFERSSVGSAGLLREDPSGAYPLQDFVTSDRYRRIVEKIARGSNADEADVARKAVDLARQGGKPEQGERARRLLPDRQGRSRA